MDLAAARKHMVECQVRPNDVTDLRIQHVFETIPREAFLPGSLREQAYAERELVYAENRRLLTPRDLAKLVAAADPQPGELVLNIASGTGYSTAILASLCEMVVAVESDSDLAARGQEILLSLDVTNAAIIEGALTDGAADQGPFDLIFIGAPVGREPAELFAQLKDGGRLVTILRSDGVSRGVVYRRSGEAIARRQVFDATAAAVLPEFAAPREFRF